MNLTESVFDSDGRKVGEIIVDAATGALDFLPRDGCPAVPGRPWRNLDDLKAQLQALYGKPLAPTAALERAAGLRGHGTG